MEFGINTMLISNSLPLKIFLKKKSLQVKQITSRDFNILGGNLISIFFKVKKTLQNKRLNT
jgi:hypothetical protein